VTNLRIADLDRRVEALLTDPERYFASARERAWASARAEVAADPARRARTRQDHHADGHE